MEECGTTEKDRTLTKGKWTRNWYLTIRTNGICTTQHLSRRMIPTNSSGILTYKRITLSRPDIVIIKKKKRTCRIVDFAIPARHRVKIEKKKKKKKNEQKDKYLYLAIEFFKKLWNMKVTLILIVIGALDTVTKGLIQGLKYLEIRGRVDTIQTTALLRSARILRKLLET